MDEQDYESNSTSPRLRWTRRWWFWLVTVLIIGLGIFGFLAYLGITHDMKQGKTSDIYAQPNDPEQEALVFSAGELSQAEKALSGGFAIQDGKDDFFIAPEITQQDIDTHYNNPQAYHLPYLDLKSLAIGADEKYLYVKHEFYGDFPKSGPAEWEGDKINSFVAKIADVRKEGSTNKTVTSLLTDGICYNCGSSVWEHGYFPNQDQDKVEAEGIKPVHGGKFYLGSNYIISSFPLNDLELKYGETIIFSQECEANSDKWHHASVDRLGQVPGTKESIQIKYRIGSNTYTTETPEETLKKDDPNLKK